METQTIGAAMSLTIGGLQTVPVGVQADKDIVLKGKKILQN